MALLTGSLGGGVTAGAAGRPTLGYTHVFEVAMSSSEERTRKRQRRRHADRIARGTCSRCGKCPPEPGLKVCRRCGEKRRAAEKVRRARARQQNLPYAGRDPEATRHAARAADKRRRGEWKAAGLCSSCGRSRPADGRSVCEPCREAKRAAERARYHARRAAGRCVRCGKPAFQGSSRCGRCAVLEAARASPERKKAVNRKRYVRRRARGFCVDCSAPVAGTARCPSCARRSNARAPEPCHLPELFPEYTVIRLDTGDVIESFETEAEAAACLVFAGLRPDQVEIRANVPLMAFGAS